MTNLIFSFDTEDYINEYGAEGVWNSARVLKEEGVKGCFQVAGWMAEALKAWGRQDIIDILKESHEVDFHARRHSWHPTINEYTDRADYWGAYRDFVTDESLGMEALKETFGVESFASACPPGNSVSYVAHYAYADMGFPVYAGDLVIDDVRSRPIRCCNILCTNYDFCVDRFFIQATEEDLKGLVELAAKRDTFVVYHHPHKSFVKHHCDDDNLKGKNTPRENWIISEAFTKEESTTFFQNFKRFVQLVKADPRFRITTFGELAKQHSSRRELTLDQLGQLRSQLEEKWFPVTLPDSYCLSDVFLACRQMLLGGKSHVCGKVYGFLDTPYAITEPVTLKKRHMIASAKWMNVDGFLPEYIYVDDQKIGPADWLRAAMAFLLEDVEEYTLMPGAWQIDLDQFPMLRDLNCKNTWVHCDSFEDKYLSHRLRLQSWTMRLQKGTPRLIKE